MFTVDGYLKQFPTAKSEHILGFYLLSMYAQLSEEDISLSEITFDVVEKYLRKFLANLEKDSFTIFQNAQIKTTSNNSELFDRILLEIESYLGILIAGIQQTGKSDIQMNRYIKDSNSYDFLYTFVRSFLLKMMIKNYELAIPTDKAHSLFPSVLNDEAFLNLVDEYTYVEPNLAPKNDTYQDYTDLINKNNRYGFRLPTQAKSKIEEWLSARKIES